jgi:hypothetical protein
MDSSFLPSVSDDGSDEGMFCDHGYGLAAASMINHAAP